MITVFADKYLYEIASLLPKEVNLHLYDPEDGVPDAQTDMDALLIRTVTKIDEHTWQQVPRNLQFIGTGSAGTDHVDLNFLDKQNIAFADAAGCNARSVAEYVATALLLWADDLGYELNHKKAGIIGMGHVGTEVRLMLNALNVTTICYDPPKEEREEDFKSADLKDVLSADILTFHTPLTNNGKYPTFHWLNEQKLANRSYDLIINTARGGVIDEQALQKAYINGTIKNYMLDVWEDEPVFNDLIARNAYIKTPHIAGYSKQAKLRASKLLAKALCSHFSITNLVNSSTQPSKKVFTDLSTESPSLSDILCQIHPIKDYEKEMISLFGLSPKEKACGFNKIRTEHHLRDEFGFIKLPEEIFHSSPQMDGLGFMSNCT